MLTPSLITQGLGGNLILQGIGSSSQTDVDPGEDDLPTLIVEDGSAMADAESYCTVAYADNYFNRRMITAWAALTLNQKSANLRKATDFMEQMFRLRWAGYRYTETQALSWPRWEVYNLDVASGYYGWSNFIGYNTVPDLVKRACCELAMKAQSGPLIKDFGRLKDRVKIGGNSGVDITYAKSSTDQSTFYSAVEGLLRPFLLSSARPGEAHSIRLERA